MALLESPQGTFEVRPSDEDGAPVYICRVPRLVDRTAYRRAVTAAGGRFPGDIEMMRELATALDRLLPESDDAEQREKLKALAAAHADAFRLFLDKKGEAPVMPPDLQQTVEEASRADPRFAGLMGDRMAYGEIAAIVAARMFLAGWENIAVPFRRTIAGGVPDDLVALIPYGDLFAISNAVSERMTPSEARLKNSDWRSGGPPAQASSPTTETPHPTVQ